MSRRHDNRWPRRPWVRACAVLVVSGTSFVSAAEPSASTRPGVHHSALDETAALLRLSPGEHLPRARSLFRAWCASDPANPSLDAFRRRVGAVIELRDSLSVSLRQVGQQVVGALIADVLGDKPGRISAGQQAASLELVPADQLYRSYLPHFARRIDVGNLDASEQRFLRAYYNAEIGEAIGGLLQSGYVLAAGGDQTHDIECYLLLLPLLHDPSRFDERVLEALPGWMLSHDRLRRLCDFCLFGVGRLDAAERIASILDRPRHAACDFYAASAQRCSTMNRPDLAVACLRSAIGSLPPGDARITELRFRICQVWASAGNLALAAGEAGQIARDFAGTEHAGRAVYLRIKYLSDQRDAQAVLYEVDDAIDDSQCEPYLAELMFLKWRALRQAREDEASVAAMKRFLACFPQHARAAEMHYAVAVDCLSAQRYDEGRRLLETLVKAFPDHRLARRARQLIERISDARSRGL